jgi:hypothetical protein
MECKKMLGINMKKFEIYGFFGTKSNREGKWLLWHFLSSSEAIKF